MSARSLALAGGAFVAMLAGPAAAVECADLRLALPREEVASRLFHEVETDAASGAWMDAIRSTNATALLLGLAIRDKNVSTFLEALRFAEEEIDRAAEQAFAVSGLGRRKSGTVPRHLRAIVTDILDAGNAIRDAKHTTLLEFCDARGSAR